MSKIHHQLLANLVRRVVCRQFSFTSPSKYECPLCRKFSQRQKLVVDQGYLLRDVTIDREDQVWASDITYIPLSRGFAFLVAIMDWWSRYVLAWQISTSLDTAFCLETLEVALQHGKPEIFYTDQGAQFTSNAFTGMLTDSGIDISMDGRGRCMDNIFTERLWRTVKCENVYLMHYESVPEGRHKASIPTSVSITMTDLTRR